MQTYLEAALWSIALLFAAYRAARTPSGMRRGWWLVLVATFAFAADKLFDLHGVFHELARTLAHALDPEHQLRGPNAIYRNVALSVGFLVAAALLYLWLRREHRPGKGMLICLLSILLVGGIVTSRAMPGLQSESVELLLKIVEGVAWLLMIAGIAIGNPKPAARAQLRDGFL